MVPANLAERVIFTGRLTRDQVRDWLRRAAVCCFPSHMETFGLAPAEAMSVERPTIYSKDGPGPEVIEDGVDGLLCDPRDPTDIARCISRLLDDPGFAAQLGRTGRRKIIALCGAPQLLARNEAFYRACIEI
jgi:glycosyltransferase involved in cell wall biosynthesis